MYNDRAVSVVEKIFATQTISNTEVTVGFWADLKTMFTANRAYYDITLSGKITRDKESTEMLDLIFTNRVYDIAAICDWGG